MSPAPQQALRVLIVEDDVSTAQFIEHALAAEGHCPDVKSNGTDGLKFAVAMSYDIVIVDRMLPGTDGLTIVKEMRRAGVAVPVLFLTALGGIDDRVEGLEAGGDDYVVKPFAQTELIARVNALVRRSSGKQDTAVMKVADLEINLIARTVRRGGQDIALQPREFKLLEVLMRNEGKIVTRTMLLEAVWDFHFDPKTSIVETHISRVRDKVDRPFAQSLIKTIRGVGYSLNDAS